MIDDTTRTKVTDTIAQLPLRIEIERTTGTDTPPYALVLGVELAVPAAEVWAHLTEPTLLAQWSPIVPDRKLGEVGPAESREDPADDPVDATVITAEPPYKLTHSWGPGLVSWMIAPLEGGSSLGLGQDFATPEDAARTAAGWHVCLAVLSLRLDGEDVERVVGTDAIDVGWEELFARYLTETPEGR